MIPAQAAIFVSKDPVDMRSGFDRLARMVQEELQSDPHNGSLFVFANRRAARLKVLWFEKNAFCMLYKRSRCAVFVIPGGSGATVRIDASALAKLLAGSARKQLAQCGLDRRSRNAAFVLCVIDVAILAQRIEAFEAAQAAMQAELETSRRVRDEYKKLHLLLEENERLKRGLLGQKAEPLPKSDAQQSLAVLGLMKGQDRTQASSPSAIELLPAEQEVASHVRRRPKRKPLPEDVPRVTIEPFPPEVEREGNDPFEVIGEETREVLERRPASLVFVKIVLKKYVGRNRDRGNVNPAHRRQVLFVV